MDKIKTVKIKNEDGSISEETYTISVDAKNVDMDNGIDLQDTIGNINIDNDGNIAEQLNNLNIDIRKKMYFFNTVADMKITDLKTGDYVYTLGYYTINDGGAGNYEIVNGNFIEDGGNYHRLNNGLYAKLIIKKEISIHCFGAKGDGIADDSNIIQLALNTTNIICGKEKNYKISKTIYINNSLNGNNSTFIIPNYENLTRESSKGIFIVNHKNIIVKDCNFIGSYTDYTQKIPYTTTKILPPILSYMDGSDNSQCIGCHFEKTNGHSVIVYGNTVNNILIENCKAIECGCGVGIEQISGSNETPKNITINNFYSECNNSCEITSGSGICVNNCYFESNGWGKGVITTNEASHDTHINFSGCKFSHTGIGADIGQSRCILIDSYDRTKNVFVNLSGCIIDGDVANVRCIWCSPLVRLSLISCEIKGCLTFSDNSTLDIINSKLYSSVNNQNILIINGENCLVNISNSEVVITNLAKDIWNKGKISIINSKIIADDNSITFKSGSSGTILNSVLTKILNTENLYGINIINSVLTNDTRFITNMGTIIGAINNPSDLANIPETVSNMSMILVITNKKVAYKYGNDWYYLDGTRVS